MALSFNGIEPVSFGGKECTPVIDTETKIRLSQIKKYDDAADEIIAAAFPDDEQYVKEFLAKKMTVLEKETLLVYLLGGEMTVKTMLEGMKESMRKVTDNE